MTPVPRFGQSSAPAVAEAGGADRAFLSLPRRQRIALLALLALAHLIHPLGWGEIGVGLWFPPAGLGLALIAWFGPIAALGLAVDGLLVVAQAALLNQLFWGEPLGADLALAMIDAWFGAAVLWASWRLYHEREGGARGLNDSRSAMLFLFLVPGIGIGAWAVVHTALAGMLIEAPAEAWRTQLAAFWLSRALGVLVLAPMLLVGLTPWLARRGLARAEVAGHGSQGLLDVIGGEERLTTGDGLEIAGLAAGAAALTWLASGPLAGTPAAGWQLWGAPLLLIVWAGLRQGLRGSTLVAGVSAGLPLALRPSDSLGGLLALLVQSNLLAQGAAALLVAASATWVRGREDRYRQVMAHVPVVIYSARFLRPGRPPLPVGDRAAEVTLVSAASGTMLGCPPYLLLGDHERWLARVHADDREVVRAAVAQVARQDQPVTCEYRLDPASLESSATEQVRWLRDTLAPHFDADGMLIGWEGVLTDITEQRVLADDLRRTSSMLHALVGNLPAGVFFVQGPGGRPVLVNARARQLLGQREDMSASLEHVAEVYRLHRPDGSRYPIEELPVYLALRKGLTTMRDDIVVHRPDGRRTPLVSWAAPIMLGGGAAETAGRQPDAAVWVLEDLTALHQSEKRYRDLVESLPLMVIQADGELRLTYANSATRAITGYDAAEIADPQTWKELVHPADLPRLLEMGQEALKGRGSRVEYRYRAKDGSEKAGLALAEPRRRPDGAIVGTTTLIVDVTRERQLEQELRRAQRLELVGRLAGGIAHDFNNLLVVVLNLAELVATRLPADHAVRDDVGRIRDAAEQASGLVGQLLTFSKQRRIAPRKIEVNRVVRRTVDLLRSTLPSSIDLQADLAPHDLCVLADETQMQQVLMNLCLNGRDAMPNGGRLQVETEFADGKARLSVSDGGTGMTEEVKAHLFDPFFTTKDHGTGLGLAVVREIVESHGGRVEVASEPGRGARFDVWWPISDG